MSRRASARGTSSGCGLCAKKYRPSSSCRHKNKPGRPRISIWAGQHAAMSVWQAAVRKPCAIRRISSRVGSVRSRCSFVRQMDSENWQVLLAGRKKRAGWGGGILDFPAPRCTWAPAQVPAGPEADAPMHRQCLGSAQRFYKRHAAADKYIATPGQLLAPK
jgi:hypothetical protein